MKFGSVCSGIGAPEIAWSSLGWEPQWFSEIAAFPSKVLAHHFPQVPNHGSLEGLSTRDVCSPVDVIVGGTPCQSFSIAGLRGGLADSRGNLALEFARLVDAVRPRWFVWENVPGVLSVNGGRDFGAIVRALAELGYGLAWRVLDARYFGVPQRRRRVFLVGNSRSAAAAAAVLFEPEGVRRHFAPRRESGEDVAGTLGGGSGGRGWAADTDRMTPMATNAEGAEGFTLTKSNLSKTVNNQTPRAVFDVAASFDPTQVTSKTNRSSCDGDSAALSAKARPPHVAFHLTQDPISSEARTPELSKSSGGAGILTSRVRRLTPRECERLQGFPDDFTLVPGSSDSSRYAALGNSMAVPVLKWLGQRIELVHRIQEAA